MYFMLTRLRASTVTMRRSSGMERTRRKTRSTRSTRATAVKGPASGRKLPRTTIRSKMFQPSLKNAGRVRVLVAAMSLRTSSATKIQRQMERPVETQGAGS